MEMQHLLPTHAPCPAWHLKDCVLRFCIFSEKPSPCRILDARLSAVEPAMMPMRSYTSFRRPWASSASNDGSSFKACSGSCNSSGYLRCQAGQGPIHIWARVNSCCLAWLAPPPL